MKRTCLFASAVLLAAVGCQKKEPIYGRENTLYLPGDVRQIWAVAPVLNLSGQPNIDPLLQADLVYEQLQPVAGLTVIPVNRVAQVYTVLRIEQIQSPEQARIVMDQLGCDGLVIATVTAYDPYNPPKFGGSLQLFLRDGLSSRQDNISPRELVRRATPGPEAVTPRANFLQSVGMYDAANGTVRDALFTYALGRQDPAGPMGAKEYFVNMDRYSGFAYHTLIEELLTKLRNGR